MIRQRNEVTFPGVAFPTGASARCALRLLISERIGALPKLHGEILDPSNGKPCFGLICNPINRCRVIPECTNPFKSAVPPLGLDHPFVAVAEYDVKERFFRVLRHAGHFSSQRTRFGLQPLANNAGARDPTAMTWE